MTDNELLELAANDDGYALRLAVQKGMYINIYVNTLQQTNVGLLTGGIVEEPHGDDPCAATRRAIVRAATSCS